MLPSYAMNTAISAASLLRRPEELQHSQDMASFRRRNLTWRGRGAVLQLPDIERQRVLRQLLPRRPVCAPGGRVLKHLPLAAAAAKFCTSQVG